MRKIKMLCMDVDGTMTDGTIYIGQNGEIMKAFNVRDGYGIANILPSLGIIPVIITGRSSKIVEYRAKELNIDELYQGVSNKLEQLKEIATKLEITADEIAYIGDDLNDLECIEYCGYSACPADADTTVKNKVNYICTNHAGCGAVREFIDMLLYD